MSGASDSRVVWTIPVRTAPGSCEPRAAAFQCECGAATCHCERSAAIHPRRILAAGLFLLAIVSPATAKYSGGSGTAQDPYQIATAADLIALGETPEDYDKHFILTADIDLDPNLPGRKVFDKAVIAADDDPEMWLFRGIPFTGVFDGNGHTISHLTILGKEYLGLFGRLDQGAKIMGLGVVDVNVSGSGRCVGGLAGFNGGGFVTQCFGMGAVSNIDLLGYVGGLVGENGGAVTQSYSTGKVKGGYAGGLVGQNESTVTHCYSTDAVSGNGNVGGLVGDNYLGTIAHCYSIGTISGNFNVGGLVGSNEGDVSQCHSTGVVSGGAGLGGLVGSNNGGSVTQCYSTGGVSGDWDGIGGLVGDNHGALTLCYSTGAVRGRFDVGGLSGSNGGTIVNCCSVGSVAGNRAVGGLVGSNSRGGLESRYRGEILCCHAAGSISGDEEVGGLVGSDNVGGQTNLSFWDTETSGQTKSAGGTGKTTAEMQDMQTYSDAGWDFAGEMNNGTHEVWQMPEEGGYPVLAILSGYNPPTLQGQGTAEDPYHISSALELGAIIHYSLSAHYRLTASIDLSGIHWATAPIPRFTGSFDGNGHAISHLTITGQGHVGLFGQLASAAQVKDLGVVDVNITCSGDAGGLAVWNNGSVTRCHSTGIVSGGGNVGGLVGDNSDGGAVTQCFSSGTVTGIGEWGSVGGLVGSNIEGHVNACYSDCAVSGSHDAGGLVGDNQWGHVIQSYSAAVVSGGWSVGGLVGNDEECIGGVCYSTYAVVTQCFWDTQTSGQATSAGGTGKTTAEMQTAKTFLNVGWDFVGEMANGTEDIWWILEGKDYPRLWWEAAKK